MFCNHSRRVIFEYAHTGSSQTKQKGGWNDTFDHLHKGLYAQNGQIANIKH